MNSDSVYTKHGFQYESELVLSLQRWLVSLALKFGGSSCSVQHLATFEEFPSSSSFLCVTPVEYLESCYTSEIHTVDYLRYTSGFQSSSSCRLCFESQVFHEELRYIFE